jgi:hypothetical protein
MEFKPVELIEAEDKKVVAMGSGFGEMGCCQAKVSVMWEKF